ncbi:hypothetical protein AB0K12_05850 [Nonomuraea sp. NPDC049419]
MQSASRFSVAYATGRLGLSGHAALPGAKHIDIAAFDPLKE